MPDDLMFIGFMGSFSNTPPSDKMINAALKFFDDAEMLGKLSPNYRINIMADFTATNSPGKEFIEIIKQTWPRYSPT